VPCRSTSVDDPGNHYWAQLARIACQCACNAPKLEESVVLPRRVAVPRKGGGAPACMLA
jgi:hypothetical protein